MCKGTKDLMEEARTKPGPWPALGPNNISGPKGRLFQGTGPLEPIRHSRWAPGALKDKSLVCGTPNFSPEAS